MQEIALAVRKNEQMKQLGGDHAGLYLGQQPKSYSGGLQVGYLTKRSGTDSGLAGKRFYSSRDWSLAQTPGWSHQRDRSQRKTRSQRSFPKSEFDVGAPLRLHRNLSFLAQQLLCNIHKVYHCLEHTIDGCQPAALDPQAQLTSHLELGRPERKGNLPVYIGGVCEGFRAGQTRECK